ncbi:D-ribose pyranase [Terrisporobacter vanillatitrophus]|uniref:D-ribose pyranase n=1 Tax=Terrisporobacter vanillatitrophus TaxID=3058402 RepID=UPI0033682DD3
MKKTKMINSKLSYVISQMGHTDSLTIGDCGLPIPCGTKRIDLALTHNVPTFIQTLDIILGELCVEEAIIASEIKEKNPEVYEAIKKKVSVLQEVSHEEFKVLTKDSKAVVRTGECSPYANIILKSGVVF